MKRNRIIALLVSTVLMMTGSGILVFAQGELTPEKKDATEITRQINENVYQLLDFSDEQEVEFAQKGFITAPESLELKDDNDNMIWSQESYNFVRDQDAPGSANPSLWRNTQLNGQWMDHS